MVCRAPAPLRREWINDAARVVKPAVAWDLGEVYVGERLEVWRTGPQYLLATKLLAGRPVDVAVLAQRCRTRTVLTLDRRRFSVMRPLDGGTFTIVP